MHVSLLINPLSILGNRRRWLEVIAITMMIIAGLLLARPAYAQGPVVDTAVDENDGSCADGDCSLRDAIATANSGETITFASDLTIYLDNQLQISNILTIDGGSQAITLSGDSGNEGSRDVRVFHIQSSGVVTLTSLNIVSGTTELTSGYDCLVVCGGGILNEGTLMINNSTLTDSQAQIWGGGIYNRGTLTINNSTLVDNWIFDVGGHGGGISNNVLGTITINHSTLSGNVARYRGAGIWNQGTLTIASSTLVGNGNILGPIQTQLGGAIFNKGSGMSTINNSTISGNQAHGGSAISNEGGTMMINNSTVSGNQVPGTGAAILNGDSGTAIVNNSTISGNQDLLGIVGGVGIANVSLGTLHLLNSIIANNGESGDECINGATIATNAYNLIEDGSCNEVAGGSPIGFLTGDPSLGPLADNGGPTWTHALLTGSPVIDQGDPNFDPNIFTPPMTYDQRGLGFNRVINGRVDIGAYEYGATSGDIKIFLPLLIKQ